MQGLQITRNAKESQAVAKEFAKELTAGDVILLYGNLGAGKTTFVQGLVQGLGIEKRIISPTFIILRTYDIQKNNEKEIASLYHADLYRLDGEKSIEGIGLLEKMKEKYAVTVIEWPEKLGALLPKKRWEIHFSQKGENEREIRIQKYE